MTAIVDRYNLAPGHDYGNMDDALHAASCLSGLNLEQGATVYSTIDPCDGSCAYVGRCGGHERYRIVVPGVFQKTTGKGWTDPGEGWRACYTVRSRPDGD